jgi:hypothetical protein
MVKDHTRYYAVLLKMGETNILISSEWFDRSMQDLFNTKRKVKAD